MSRRRTSALLAIAARQRRLLRESEAAFIVLAVLAGIAAGVATDVQQFLAHALQHLFYGVNDNRLSALGSIRHPWRLLALPLGGLVLVLMAGWFRRRPLIDVVEANALHGGRLPPVDNLIVAGQTIVSNGTGASVGLEATYAQMGGGIASLLGQWMKLRRNDLRTLVGAGAGAAVGAAFGAPIAGAFYAFEIVIGSYTPAAIAPVMAAALSATFMIQFLGGDPWLIATTASDRVMTLGDYFAYAVLGLVCALLGIVVMRLVSGAELLVQGWKRPGRWRPVIGGLLLMPIAWVSPQSLSSGHGALHLNLVLHPAIGFLTVVLVLKILACVVSLSFGFRGGLFFASLFLGSLVGQIFAAAAGVLPFAPGLDSTDAALVGMAALSVSIVGGPMTLAMLMLETTHDFALTGVVLTAALISGAVTREVFGYSFSTWRLHLRGATIRSPRDIGWMVDLTAGRIMRRDWISVERDMTVADFRARVALGSASKAVLTDAAGHYAGIVVTAAVWRPDLDTATPLSALATLQDVTVTPGTNIKRIIALFDEVGADEIAVVDELGKVRGIITENHARRRCLEEIEAAQRAAFGEY